MAVTSILRDTPNNVCIVRMISTDTVAALSGTNYIANQMDNIRALNGGFWQWYISDMVLCSCSDGVAMYEFTDETFATLEQYGANPSSSVTPQEVQYSVFDYAVDTGPDNTHFVVSLNPAITSLSEGLWILMKPADSNDVSPTLKVNALAAKPITGQGGAPLQAGDITVNNLALFYYNATIDSFVLQNPQTYTGVLPATKIIVGNASNFATEVNMSGDATISDTGVITITKSGVLTWNDQTTSATAAVNNGYVIDHGATLVTMTLPVTAPLGSVVGIAGTSSGGWVLAAGAGQTIKLGNQSASTSLASSNQYDCVEVICTVANTTWVARSSMGNLTVL